MKHFTLYFSILLNKQGASYSFNFRSLAKTTFVFFFVFLSLNGFSSSVKADSTENFKLQITLLAGYPNRLHLLIAQLPLYGIQSKYIFESKPALGFRISYDLDERISLGLEYHRLSAVATPINSTNNANDTKRIKLGVQRFYGETIIYPGNFLKIKPYVLGGLGIVHWSKTIEETRLNQLTTESSVHTFLTARLAGGFRFCLNKNFGFITEAGIGGPILVAGIWIRP